LREPLYFLVGCKHDLPRGAASRPAVALATGLGCRLYAETSAQADFNVQPLFARVAVELATRWALDGGEPAPPESAGPGIAASMHVAPIPRGRRLEHPEPAGGSTSTSSSSRRSGRSRCCA
jgi:hypothetical protein